MKSFPRSVPPYRAERERAKAGWPARPPTRASGTGHNIQAEHTGAAKGATTPLSRSSDRVDREGPVPPAIGVRASVLAVDRSAVRQVEQLRYRLKARLRVLLQIAGELLHVGPALLHNTRALAERFLRIGHPAFGVVHQHVVVIALLQAAPRIDAANFRLGDRP